MGHYCYDHLNIGVKEHLSPACLVELDYKSGQTCGYCNNKAQFMTTTHKNESIN